MAELMVVDASVAFKWFVKDEEPDADAAQRILAAFLAGDIELHAPRIFMYEVCGALARACLQRSSRLTRPVAIEHVRCLFQLPIHTSEPTEARSIKAPHMAVQYHKGHYDMTYVQLAEELGCRWCTADEKVIEAVPQGFPRGRVLLLSDLLDE